MKFNPAIEKWDLGYASKESFDFIILEDIVYPY